MKTKTKHRKSSRPSGQPLVAQRCAGCLDPTARARVMGIFVPTKGRAIQCYYLCKQCAPMIGTPELTAKIEQYLSE